MLIKVCIFFGLLSIPYSLVDVEFILHCREGVSFEISPSNLIFAWKGEKMDFWCQGEKHLFRGDLMKKCATVIAILVTSFLSKIIVTSIIFSEFRPLFYFTGVMLFYLGIAADFCLYKEFEISIQNLEGKIILSKNFIFLGWLLVFMYPNVAITRK